MLDSQSFVVGFVVGFLFTIILGNFTARIGKNRSASSRPGKKVAVSVKGDDSPREIVGKAAGAGARMTIWFLVVVALVVLTLYSLYRIWSLPSAPPFLDLVSVSVSEMAMVVHWRCGWNLGWPNMLA